MSTTTEIATKDQERKALAQIKKIVEGLGPQSYVATAFEGCFQDAEDNIENDFGCSMKQRLESAGFDIEALKAKLAAAKEQTENLEAEIKRLDSANNEFFQQVKDLTTAADSLKHFLTEQKEATAAEQQRADTAEQTIVQLKAKLYDLLVK